jgi:hypothetical protein
MEKNMKYDDASWHYGGSFPPDLEPKAGATHIGMFTAWCVLNGFGGELHIENFTDDLDRLRSREVTPGEWFMGACDGKFTDEDLNDEGNAFTAFYYSPEPAPYLTDYEDTLGHGLASLYHVPDTWHSFDRLSPLISRRYEEWKQLPI